jgi:hypothetical protein
MLADEREEDYPKFLKILCAFHPIPRVLPRAASGVEKEEANPGAQTQERPPAPVEHQRSEGTTVDHMHITLERDRNLSRGNRPETSGSIRRQYFASNHTTAHQSFSGRN